MNLGTVTDSTKKTLLLWQCFRQKAYFLLAYFIQQKQNLTFLFCPFSTTFFGILNNFKLFRSVIWTRAAFRSVFIGYDFPLPRHFPRFVSGYDHWIFSHCFNIYGNAYIPIWKKKLPLHLSQVFLNTLKCYTKPSGFLWMAVLYVSFQYITKFIILYFKRYVGIPFPEGYLHEHLDLSMRDCLNIKNLGKWLEK